MAKIQESVWEYLQPHGHFINLLMSSVSVVPGEAQFAKEAGLPY